MSKPKQFEYITFVIPAPLTEPVSEFISENPPSLAKCQALVGGYIETVPYFTRYENYTRGTAYANEEGILRGLPLNYRASEAWQRCFPATNSGLCGTVIITFRRPRIAEEV